MSKASKTPKAAKAANRDVPARRQELIDRLKRVAKRKRRQVSEEFDNTPLSTLRDGIAKMLGYDIWSVIPRGSGFHGTLPRAAPVKGFWDRTASAFSKCIASGPANWRGRAGLFFASV